MTGAAIFCAVMAIAAIVEFCWYRRAAYNLAYQEMTEGEA